jgi:hypothetical protein
VLLVPREETRVAVAQIVCEAIASGLRECYEQLDANGNKPGTSDVLEFLQNRGTVAANHISPDAPVNPHDTAYDFSVCLLPESLESVSPALAAYTGPIEMKTGRLYRIAVFLRDEDFVALSTESHLLEKIVGEERVKHAKPDFYYWHHPFLRENQTEQPENANPAGPKRPATKESDSKRLQETALGSGLFGLTILMIRGIEVSYENGQGENRGGRCAGSGGRGIG